MHAHYYMHANKKKQKPAPAHGEATASGAFANKCFGVPCRCRRYMYILAVKYVIPI